MLNYVVTMQMVYVTANILNIVSELLSNSTYMQIAGSSTVG